MSWTWKPTNKKIPFSQTDNFYFRREILDANRPFQYATDGSRWKPLADCAQYIVGQAYSTGGGWAQNKIDIDSDLRRQFRPLSNCPSKKFPNKFINGNSVKNGFINSSLRNGHGNGNGNGLEGFGNGFETGIGSIINCKSCDKCNKGLPCSCKHCKNNIDAECKDQIIPEQTRAFGKSCNIPGAFFNNFVVLPDNVQKLDKIDSNQKIGLDSRNTTKDGYLDKNYKSIAKTARLPKKNCFNVVPSNM